LARHDEEASNSKGFELVDTRLTEKDEGDVAQLLMFSEEREVEQSSGVMVRQIFGKLPVTIGAMVW
jgi:hypothetical protein